MNERMNGWFKLVNSLERVHSAFETQTNKQTTTLYVLQDWLQLHQ